MSERAGLRRKVGNGLSYRMLRWAAKLSNKEGDSYSTFMQRPKRAHVVETRPLKSQSADEPVAIVMQGPITAKDDFTLETLALYRRQWPEVQLILSTWVDTAEHQIKSVQALGVDVVLSNKPAIPGLLNVNMQLTSAQAGIRRAAEAGAIWVMKTRTDQRLYDPDSIGTLVAMAKSFPVFGKLDQRYRILGIGHGSLLFAPYHVTDQTVFGHVEDMEKYWSAPLRTESPPPGISTDRHEIYLKVPIGASCRHAAPESYIASEFLKRIGRSLDWTVSDTWTAYRDHFCFVDYVDTDFFWPKSQVETLSERDYCYHGIWTRKEVSFGLWLQLFSGMIDPKEAAPYEGALDVMFRDLVPVRA